MITKNARAKSPPWAEIFHLWRDNALMEEVLQRDIFELVELEHAPSAWLWKQRLDWWKLTFLRSVQDGPRPEGMDAQLLRATAATGVEGTLNSLQECGQNPELIAALLIAASCRSRRLYWRYFEPANGASTFNMWGIEKLALETLSNQNLTPPWHHNSRELLPNYIFDGPCIATPEDVIRHLAKEHIHCLSNYRPVVVVNTAQRIQGIYW